MKSECRPIPPTAYPAVPHEEPHMCFSYPAGKTGNLYKYHDDLTSAAKEIMKKKNHDYTGGSGDPYANFRMSESLNVHPAIGLCLRIGDKLQRISTFAKRGELRVDGEGVRDACIDIINYAILAYGLLMDGEKD